MENSIPHRPFCTRTSVPQVTYREISSLNCGNKTFSDSSFRDISSGDKDILFVKDNHPNANHAWATEPEHFYCWIVVPKAIENVWDENIEYYQTITNSQISKSYNVVKNITGHGVHTMVSWPHKKQWLMIQIPDLMMRIKWSTTIVATI